jgi:hypothetical protein
MFLMVGYELEEDFVLPHKLLRTSNTSGRCNVLLVTSSSISFLMSVRGKAIPLQALTGPEDSRRLRLPDFKTIGT